jgi:site-specific recombinase XerD
MNTSTVIQDYKTAPPIQDVVRAYELANQAEGKSDKTVRWYNEMLRSFQNYLAAQNQCADLSIFNIHMVRDYILYLRSKPKFAGHPDIPKQDKVLSPRTVLCHIRALKAFSSWLHSEGYTEENRLKNLKLPKAPATIVEPLSTEEMKAIFASVNKNSPIGFRNHVILLTVLDTGLRASEATGIRLGNINVDDGYIKVMGKGQKERIVPVGKVVQKVLWTYITMMRPKPHNADCDRLFLSSTGNPITVNTIKLLFSRLAKASGVTRLHAHLCRHTFAINYLLNGGDIFSLQAILGHTTLEMVRHYLHFTSSQVAALHHKYSPIDKLHSEEGKVDDKVLSALSSAK